MTLTQIKKTFVDLKFENPIIFISSSGFISFSSINGFSSFSELFSSWFKISILISFELSFKTISLFVSEIGKIGFSAVWIGRVSLFSLIFLISSADFSCFLLRFSLEILLFDSFLLFLLSLEEDLDLDELFDGLLLEDLLYFECKFIFF